MGGITMGDKRPSVRTLPNGDRVTHYPDGRQVLVPRNTVAVSLKGREEDQLAASAELRDALVDAATAKREAQDGGNQVPSDKRAI